MFGGLLGCVHAPHPQRTHFLTIHFPQVACKQDNVFMWQPVQLNLKQSCMIMRFIMFKFHLPQLGIVERVRPQGHTYNPSNCTQGNLVGHSGSLGDIAGGRSDCTMQVRYETVEVGLP